MRLVTRGNFDGLICAILLAKHFPIDDILLIHPQQITDGEAEIGEDDILANLPYHASCAMWFDNHPHTATVSAPPPDMPGRFGFAPSTSRLVYEHFGGHDTMPEMAEMVRYADRLTTADLTAADINDPQGLIQIGLTIDSRSGLGAFHGYFLTLFELFGKGLAVDEILAHPEVERRCRALEEADAKSRLILLTHSRLDGNVVITDLRETAESPVGNRFLVYGIFRQANVSVRLQWGPRKEGVMMMLGHSILNRTCKTNLGELAARYGGGGHPGAASVPLIDDPDYEIGMILAELKANG